MLSRVFIHLIHKTENSKGASYYPNEVRATERFMVLFGSEMKRVS